MVSRDAVAEGYRVNLSELEKKQEFKRSRKTTAMGVQKQSNYSSSSRSQPNEDNNSLRAQSAVLQEQLAGNMRENAAVTGDQNK